MLPSTRNLPSEDRKERLPLSQRHHFLPASYFVHGTSGMMQPSSQILLESTNSYHSMAPWTPISAPCSQDLGPSNYVSSWLSSNSTYELSYGPSSVLPSDSFSTLSQDCNVFDAPGNSYPFPESQYLPWMDSIREVDGSAHGLNVSNLATSDCVTPLMENDASLDLDFTGDPLITPSESAGFPWNGPSDTTNLPYPGLCGNIDTHRYNLGSSEAQSPVESFPITVDSDETIVYTHYGPTMRLNYQEILPSGQAEQQDMPFGADAESWRCEVPGCGKTFDKRHRFNKHIASHSRLLRCPFKNCKRRAYQEKDIKRHIAAVHHKAKLPCPVEGCPYSQNGPKRGISRKDALMRHQRSHDASELPPGYNTTT